MTTWTMTTDARRVFEFARELMPMAWVENMKGIGLERDGVMVAACLFEGWNGHNVWVHLAGAPGCRWMTKAYLRECFNYAFVTAGCTWLRGYVEASNSDARRFDEHIGFKQEAVLKGAASDGGDVILYVMHRDECRFLGDRHGQ